MICKYCGQEKEEKDFEIANIIKGIVYRRKKCSTCKTKRQRERINEIKQVMIELKKELKCANCHCITHAKDRS